LIMRRWITALFLGLFVISAKADVVVLVHGYLGSAASWGFSGISGMLQQTGWQPAGVMTPHGLAPMPGATAQHKFYTVELPSLEPIALQAGILRDMLIYVTERHPQEALILVGHSAGGVVARLTLVQGRVPHAKALITIASPHLGTLRAVEALDKTDDPFPISTFKSFFAGELYDVVRNSWGVLLDLTPEQPGNLLFWLNRQPHPEINYLSVIRSGPVGMGDELAPAYSQDMNNVIALRGKVETRQTPLSHILHPMDGQILAEILSTF
jgi:pimeloyl-ACP methyl ester carboxylesterase